MGTKGTKARILFPRKTESAQKKNNLYPKIKIAKVAEKINSKKLYL